MTPRGTWGRGRRRLDHGVLPLDHEPLDPTGAMIGSRAVPPLAKGASSSATSSVVIPAGIGGDFYVIALANADAGIEVAAAPNNTKWKAIRIGPDLSVSALTSPALAAAGATISVTDVTRNTAAVGAPASTTRYFLSTTSVLASGAPLVGVRAVPALATGASSSGSASVTIPTGTMPGVHFLIAKGDGDDAIVEYNETNNTRARAITILPGLHGGPRTGPPSPPTLVASQRS